MDIETRRFIEERLLTTQEVADLLDVPVPTVQMWASRHKVDWVLKGRTYLFDRDDFRDFERPGTAGRPGRRAKSGPHNAQQDEPAGEPMADSVPESHRAEGAASVTFQERFQNALLQP